jgi:GNAT superfamily N-acetyltransferase
MSGSAPTLGGAVGQDEAVCSASLDIHELRPAEQPRVRALILAGLAQHWGCIDPAFNRDLDDLAAAYPDSTTLVATSGGEVVGTGTIVRRDETTAEIVRMSVSVRHRRSGLGRRLVGHLLDVAREWGIERVVLETSAAWTEVVTFYERCGFTLTHHDHGEFGRDAWFEMTLR